MSKERAARASFGALLPGDVLIHRSNEADAVVVTRVGTKLDFLHLMDGRFLFSWVFAAEPIPPPYDVIRGETVLFRSETE